MNKTDVRNIIETTLKSGSKNPGLFDLPKMLSLRSKLESCTAIDDVVAILENNRGLVTKAFGLGDAVFNDGLNKLKALKKTA